MAFVHHDQVILVDRRHVLLGEHALHQALDGADMHLGRRVGGDVGQFLDAEDVGEGARADDAGGLELTGGLLAERGAVHHEADPAEPLGGEQAIQHGDRQL